MPALEFTAAEWGALTDDHKALVKGCTRFGMGEPKPVYAAYDDEGNPIGQPTAYVVNHPKFRIDDMIRATEALEVPAKDVPASRIVDGVTVRPSKRELFDVVEKRVRPRDAQGEVTDDKIEARKAAIAALQEADPDTPVDVKAKLREEAKKRPVKGAEAPKVESRPRGRG